MTKSLQVLFYGPAGRVRQTRFVWVVFSEPMVVLGPVSRQLPVRISNFLPGRWRWAGPRTLVLEGRNRLPGSTEFTVEVHPLARSLSGAVLGERLVWSFSTEPVRLERLWPLGRYCHPHGLFVFGADQRIDPEGVLPHLELQVSGRPVELVLADESELQAHEEAYRAYSRYPADQRLAVRAREPLPRGQKAALVQQGVPSLEGPLTDPRRRVLRLLTPGPLRLRNASLQEVGSSDYGGPSLAHLSLEFNRRLDHRQDLKRLIRVRPGGIPERPGWPLFHVDPTVREYRVQLHADLKDELGCRPERRITLRLAMPTSRPRLFQDFLSSAFGVLPPGVDGLPVACVNGPALEVEVQHVRLRDWPEQVQRHAPPLADEPTQAWHEQLETPWNEPAAVVLDTGDTRRHRVIRLRPPQEPGRPNFAPLPVWIQPTDLGISVRPAPSGLIVWVTSLRDGRPLPHVEVWSLPQDELEQASTEPHALTGTDGLCFLPHLDARPVRRAVLARRGEDVAFLPEPRYHEPSNWSGGREGRRLLWCVFDDRGLYRPGEEALVQGWLRIGRVEGGRAAPPGAEIRELRYRIVRDRTSKVLERGTLQVDEHGAFRLLWAVPPDLEPGNYQVLLQAKVPPDVASWSRFHGHRLEVGCFVRPEFRVEVQAAAPVFRGEEVALACRAGYYSGGAVRDAAVRWELRTEPKAFRPTGWPDFRFGIAPAGEPLEETRTCRTDAEGRNDQVFRPDPSLWPEEHLQVEATATVADRNGYRRSGRRRLVVHPSGIVLGLRLRRRFLSSEDPLDLEAAAVDLEGSPVAGVDVELRVLQETSELVALRFRTSSRPEPLRVQSLPPGCYQLLLEARDSRGRLARSQVPLWVLGPELGVPRSAASEVRLEPDRDRYRPGEVARLLVLSAVHPANGLLTLTGGGTVECRTFRLEGPWTTLEIPMDRAHVPGLLASVEVIRDGVREPRIVAAPSDPDRGLADALLAVDDETERLRVDVSPLRTQVGPGDEVEVAVRVREAGGEPLAGVRVALVAVDQAVTDMAGHHLPDPLREFRVLPRPLSRHGDGPLQSGPAHDLPPASLHGHLLRVDPHLLTPTVHSPVDFGFMRGHAPDGGGREAELRRCFRPLAAWESDLQTDAEGRVLWRFRMPDDLTRWRVSAVACAGDRGGAGEALVTTFRALTVRPSPPRFLRVGDRALASVVVHNHTGRRVDAPVEAEASGQPVGRQTLSVPAGDRALVRVPMEPTGPGELVLRVRTEGDGVEVAVPVRPATSPRVAAASGWFRGRERLDLQIPPDAQDPRVRLTLATGLEGDLVGGVRRLLRCRWPASEPSAGRVLAFSALLDSPARARLREPLVAAMERRLEKDLRQLVDFAGKGFRMWRGGRPDPYLTFFVGLAVVQAERAGSEIPAGLRRAVVQGLRLTPPGSWSRAGRRAWRAGALRVLRLLAEEVPEEPVAGGAQSLEEAALRLAAGEQPMLQEALNRLEMLDLDARSTVLPGVLAEFPWSPRRGLALLLQALPADSQLVPRLASGLIAGLPSHGHDLVWALTGLAGASRFLEHPSPTGLARVRAGGLRSTIAVAGSGWRRSRVLPDASELHLSYRGEGRLSYRAELRWDEPPDVAAALDEGLALDRRYEGEGPQIVAGTRVRVTLTLVCPARRSHLVLVDPLPAGLEVEDRRGCEVEQSVSVDTDRAPIRFGGRWTSHFRFYDDRVEVFAERLPGGVYTFSYMALARTPGEFVVPPARVDELYRPEVRAKTRWKKVLVLATRSKETQ